MPDHVPCGAYSNNDAPAGPVPIKVVVLKDTKVIKVVGKETGVPLSGTLGDVVLRITTGTTRNCARFDAGKFIAKGAVSSSLTDCASGAPTTSTSTTTSTSSSTSTSSTTTTSTSTSSTTSTTLESPSGAFLG